MSRTARRLRAVLVVGIAVALTACAGEQNAGTHIAEAEQGKLDLIEVGFVAVGPEGAWREANEGNIIATFSEDAGFHLEYAPARGGTHSSQVGDFHTFLDAGVDLILLSAIDSEGWEQPLARAHINGTPVILIDRGVTIDAQSPYATRVAPDNVAVATAAAEWAVSEFPAGATYFTLEGPPRVSVVDERNQGWDSVMSAHPEFVEYGAQAANWSAEEARVVFGKALAASGNSIDMVFAHNDEMGLGAAQAVEEAGLTPGVDVKIATIDGTFSAMDALAQGRLNFVAEYNPIFQDTVLDAARKVLAGETVEPFIVVPSQVFDDAQEAYDILPDRRY